MAGSAASPSKLTTEPADRDFMIRLSAEASGSPLHERICQDVQRLGGQPLEAGYAFATATERAAALDVLGDNYGARYFEPIGC